MNCATKKVRVIAHRGASAYAPENTLPAFKVAQSMGVYDVELDIQLTKDQKIILFHDKTLDRKTNLKGKIKDYTLAELRTVDIGTWFDQNHQVENKYGGLGLITLEDLFRTFGKSFYYHVEIKVDDPFIVRLLYEMILKYKLEEQVIVTSFKIKQLIGFRQLVSTIGFDNTYNLFD